jgi:hypothetical protein
VGAFEFIVSLMLTEKLCMVNDKLRGKWGHFNNVRTCFKTLKTAAPGLAASFQRHKLYPCQWICP